MKRMLLALLGLMLVLSPADAASAKGGPPATERSDVAFTIPAGQCPNLSAGTSIETTSGTLVSRTHTIVKRGVTTTFNVTRAVGTAVDNEGNEYRFFYRNTLRVSGTGEAFTGLMTDAFRLHGGPERLTSGFTALVTSTGPTAENVTGFTEVLSQHGDPYDFINFMPICDPL